MNGLPRLFSSLTWLERRVHLLADRRKSPLSNLISSVLHTTSSLEMLIAGGLQSNNEDQGLVIDVSGSYIKASGLKSATLGSLVCLNDGAIGVVMKLENDSCSIAKLTTSTSTEEPELGSSLQILKRFNHHRLGFSNIFSIFDIISKHYHNELNEVKSLFTFPKPPPRSMRKPINSRLPTGINSIELLSPIGKGQSILFHGPKGTGKTSTVFTIITNLLLRNDPYDKIVIITFGSTKQYMRELKLLPERILSNKNFGNFGNDIDTPSRISSIRNQISEKVFFVNPWAEQIDNEYNSISLPKGHFILAPICALKLATSFRMEGNSTFIIFDDIVDYFNLFRDTDPIERSLNKRSYPLFPFTPEYILSQILSHTCNSNSPLGPLTTLLIYNKLVDSYGPINDIDHINNSLIELVDIPIEFQLPNISNSNFTENVIKISLNSLNVTFNPPLHPLLKLVGSHVKNNLLLAQERFKSENLKQKFKLFSDFWDLDELNSLKSFENIISIQILSEIFSITDSLIITRAASLFYFPNKLNDIDEILKFHLELLSVFKSNHRDTFLELDRFLNLVGTISTQTTSSSDLSVTSSNSSIQLLEKLDRDLYACHQNISLLIPNPAQFFD